MEKHIKLIFGLLILSIILNFYSISVISNMRDIMRQDVRNLVQDIVEDDLEDIKEEVKVMKEEQQWISEIAVSHVQKSSDRQAVKFNWNIKKFKPGSEVMFYYKNSEEDFYQQLMVDSTSIGNYFAEFQYKVSDGPEWAIRYIGNEGNINTIKNESPNIYDYYVALNDGTQVLTGNVESINLSKLSNMYSTIHAEIMTNKDNEPMQVELFSEEYDINTEALILEVHNGSSIEELKAEGKETWARWVLNDKTFDKLIIKAQYNDNKTFTKEIWTK